MAGRLRCFQILNALRKERLRHNKDDPVWDSSCSSSLVIRTKIYLITRYKNSIAIKIELYQIVGKVEQEPNSMSQNENW